MVYTRQFSSNDVEYHSVVIKALKWAFDQLGRVNKVKIIDAIIIAYAMYWLVRTLKLTDVVAIRWKKFLLKLSGERYDDVIKRYQINRRNVDSYDNDIYL